MIEIKIEDNKENNSVDIEFKRKNVTEVEKLFADSISRCIDKLILK